MGLLGRFSRKPASPEAAPLPDPVLEKIPKPFAPSGQSTPGYRSNRGSVTPSTHSTMSTLKYEVMANFLSQEQLKRKWLRGSGSNSEGCFIRKGQADYVTCPSNLADSGSALAVGIAALNPQVPDCYPLKCDGIRS